MSLFAAGARRYNHSLRLTTPKRAPNSHRFIGPTAPWPSPPRPHLARGSQSSRPTRQSPPPPPLPATDSESRGPPPGPPPPRQDMQAGPAGPRACWAPGRAGRGPGAARRAIRQRTGGEQRTGGHWPGPRPGGDQPRAASEGRRAGGPTARQRRRRRGRSGGPGRRRRRAGTRGGRRRGRGGSRPPRCRLSLPLPLPLSLSPSLSRSLSNTHTLSLPPSLPPY
jgi:translation initiation factor IF-2